MANYFNQLPRDLQREILYRLPIEELFDLIREYEWIGEDVGVWKRRGLKYHPADNDPPWQQYITQRITRELRYAALPNEFILRSTPPRVLLGIALEKKHTRTLVWLCEQRLIPPSEIKRVLNIFGKYGDTRGIRCLEDQGVKIPWNELFRIALVEGTQPAALRLMRFHQYDLAFLRNVIGEIGSGMVV